MLIYNLADRATARASATLDPSSFVCCFCFGDGSGRSRKMDGEYEKVGRTKARDGGFFRRWGRGSKGRMGYELIQ